ncbi:hypothetical protein KUCAC02_029889 [Chaenocephalus aceratus]|uniref:Uncharacterized protein n=1 Tax=Chaenocephalus aceratus TaxID=36190 RepID=A0ACB9XIG5_CHAAC|nr:hypothetical protein KUCAC02_029889 [Chaenocephalus aceratus]
MDKKLKSGKKNIASDRHTDTTRPEIKRVSGEEDSVILAEIRKLRDEHTEATNDTKEALTRLDNVLKDMVERTASLEQRMVKTEERLGDTEDRMARLERSVAFLLHQEAKLAAKCDDF